MFYFTLISICKVALHESGLKATVWDTRRLAAVIDYYLSVKYFKSSLKRHLAPF